LEDNPEQPAEQTDHRSIALLLTTRILRSIAAGAINLVFAYLVLVDLKAWPLILGSIYTIALLSTSFIGLALGFSADIFGRKFAYLIALLLLPIATLLVYYFSQNLVVVFIAAAIGGFSATGSLAGGGVGGAAVSVQSAILTDLAPRNRRTFYYSTLTFIAGMAGSGGAYVGRFFTIPEIFAIGTVLSVGSVLVSMFIRIPHRERKPPARKMKTGKIIGKFSITGILNGMANGLVTPFFIPFFISVYGLQRSEMGIYVAIGGVIGSFSLLLAPMIERRLGFLKGMVSSRGISALLTVIFPFIRILPFSLAIYLIFPATRVVGLPVQQTAMMDMVDKEERGRAFGINQSARLLASGGGSVLSGYEFEIASLDTPFVLYGVLMGLNLYFYMRFFSSYRRSTYVQE
jgi:MFS family permease